MDSVYDVILGSLTVRQCRNTRYNPAIEQIIGRYSGGIDPQTLHVSKATPMCTFDTDDLGTGLAIGTDTFCSAGLHTSNGTITIPFARRSIGALFAGTLSHMRLNGTYALHVPTSISGQQNQDATMSINTHFYTPTGVVPVTASTGATLGSQSYVAKYTMGTGWITPSGGSSTQLTQVVGITVTPGIRVFTEFFNGGIYPSWIGIDLREPTIEFTVKSFDDLAAYGPIGAGVDGVLATFRKRADGGTLVSDASSVHIGFTFGAALATISDITANEQTGTGTIKITGKALTCDTTYALA